ncbi:DUF2911 domain-containing protein [Pedobacter sp. HMF7647]|uniref:DUF2911 domain-containing protein n=1 Tax=Hufsiella arboris TaxID=2695275 RepID=A0A7K1Y6V5_9SPHI|nr:DUF2911 domain-containing protein [Hufsiella arboris]MXV50170.1 DUF2911 domain-containing protein [Hufsiella arboris]
MKTFIKNMLPLVFAAATLPSLAQLKLPQPSSGQTISQDLGLGKVNITYARPNVKGRTVFGGLVPYGEVWRTGANSATTIEFTDNVSLAGHAVAPGTYGLFTIPGKSEWTIILNKTAKQWGAYEYKKEDDVLRFTVKASTVSPAVETFTIQFSDVKEKTANMDICWDKTKVSVPLSTDIDVKVMANIEEAMKGEKKPYMQAAMYYYDNNKDMKKALEWVNEADKANPKEFYIKYWKARILLKNGDKQGAIATAQEGVQLAKDAKTDEYVRLNESVIAQAK